MAHKGIDCREEVEKNGLDRWTIYRTRPDSDKSTQNTETLNDESDASDRTDNIIISVATNRHFIIDDMVWNEKTETALQAADVHSVISYMIL